MRRQLLTGLLAMTLVRLQTLSLLAKTRSVALSAASALRRRRELNKVKARPYRHLAAIFS